MDKKQRKLLSKIRVPCRFGHQGQVVALADFKREGEASVAPAEISISRKIIPFRIRSREDDGEYFEKSGKEIKQVKLTIKPKNQPNSEWSVNIEHKSIQDPTDSLYFCLRLDHHQATIYQADSFVQARHHNVRVRGKTGLTLEQRFKIQESRVDERKKEVDEADFLKDSEEDSEKGSERERSRQKYSSR